MNSILTFILLFAFVCGCTTKKTLQSDELISIVLDSSAASAEITYNSSHPGADYKGSQDLFATIRYVNQYGSFLNRVQLTSTSNGLFQATVKVPSDAIVIDAEIVPRGVYMTQMRAQIPITRDGIAVSGSLPYMMWSAPSFEEAVALFERDAALYPDDFTRFLPLWAGQLRSNLNIEQVRQQIDSLMKVSYEASRKGNSNRLIILSGRLMNEILSEQWEKATTTASEIRTLVEKNPQVNSNLEMLFSMLIPKYIKVGSGIACDNKTCLASLEQLCAMVSISKSPLLIATALRGMDSTAIARYPTCVNHLMEAAVRLLSASTDSIGLYMQQGNDIVLSAVRTLQFNERHADAVEIGERGLSALNLISDWTGASADDLVSYIPLSGMKLTVALFIANSVRALGDTARSIEMLKNAFYRYPDAPENSRSYVAAKLSLEYADQEAIDSASKFYAFAATYKSPFTASIATRLDTMRSERGLSPLQLDEIIQRYNITRMPGTRVPFASIETATGRIVFGECGDTTIFLLFSSSNCGVCRDKFPELVKELKTMKNVRIVAVTDDFTHYQHLFHGSAEYVELTPEIRAQFEVLAFPTVVVISNEMVKLNLAGLSQTSVQELLSTFRN